MAIQLEKVVPFGRSLDEYVQMFNLTGQDLQKRILGVADGPASFNAEGTKLGYKITSVDPIYALSTTQIRNRFNHVVDDIIQQIKATPDDWVWTYHGSPEGLRRNRQQSLDIFCQDYEVGKAQKRYQVGELPGLIDGDREYDLGLCSHFLFLYSDHFDADFHFHSIGEMLRVCQEVRIFPLLTLRLNRSQHLKPILQRLEVMGYTWEIQKVSYELQRGGNEMLRICQ